MVLYFKLSARVEEVIESRKEHGIVFHAPFLILFIESVVLRKAIPDFTTPR